MPDRVKTIDTVTPPGRWSVWGVVMVILCGWVAIRLGILDLSSTVSVYGQQVDVVNMYGAIDHPFHATRAATLLDSLRNGEILRWIGHHQGGYPAEFYPLGVPWLDVAIWAVSLGSISILAAHKIAVILVFLLPALSYWLLARGDRVHPSVAVLAAAVHFAIPGHWLNGGYEELVGWGLVTNVAGASLALLASVALARFVLNREFGMGVLATLAATGGAVTNPRSLFAIVVAAIGVGIVALLTDRDLSIRGRVVAVALRIGAVGGIALLLSAPVVFALFRYNSLYFFLHYESYDPISQYWTAVTTAITTPGAILAIAGLILALIPAIGASIPISRGLAATLIGYVVLTIWVAMATVVPPLVEQLEAPRLMPYQRQLMIWLAALAVGLTVRYLTGKLGRWSREILPSVVTGGLAVIVLVVFVAPLGFISDARVGLREPSTTGNVDHATFVAAIERAASIQPEGTAMMVVGNRDEGDWWHQQLWAPAYADGRFFYDDWMWYWHDDHPGPYTPENGYWMPNPTEALEGEYLEANGIGVVVVTDMWVPAGEPPRVSARSNPRLTHVETFGAWDVYAVAEPTSLVVSGESLPEDISVDNHLVTATFDDTDGTVTVRQNWYPRWSATVNGTPVELVRRDDGYIDLDVPAGPVELRLEYRVTGLDTVARMASVTGLVMLALGAWRGPALLHRISVPRTGESVQDEGYD